MCVMIHTAATVQVWMKNTRTSMWIGSVGSVHLSIDELVRRIYYRRSADTLVTLLLG